MVCNMLYFIFRPKNVAMMKIKKKKIRFMLRPCTFFHHQISVYAFSSSILWTSMCHPCWGQSCWSLLQRVILWQQDLEWFPKIEIKDLAKQFLDKNHRIHCLTSQLATSSQDNPKSRSSSQTLKANLSILTMLGLLIDILPPRPLGSWPAHPGPVQVLVSVVVWQLWASKIKANKSRALKKTIMFT